MRLYFVYTDSTAIESEVIRELRPERLLLSYYYFRNKPLESVIDKIGYTPKIMLDSGAYSAATKGRNISPIDYMRYVEDNARLIEHYVALDVIGDSESTRYYYEIMRAKGFRPIPVFHYREDLRWLHRYVFDGNEYIALGGCAPIRKKADVAEWCTDITKRYPVIKFHLLGSSSRQVTGDCELYSVDSSTWVMMAINGYPKTIPGKSRQARAERAKWQMRKLKAEYKEGISC